MAQRWKLSALPPGVRSAAAARTTGRVDGRTTQWFEVSLPLAGGEWETLTVFWPTRGRIRWGSGSWLGSTFGASPGVGEYSDSVVGEVAVSERRLVSGVVMVSTSKYNL